MRRNSPRLFLLPLLLLCSLLRLGAQAHAGTTAQQEWYNQKYSLFIHYGLYSVAGGVWDGKPVTQGYSEQILTFGVGFSDYYEALTQEFTAADFNAQEIVRLAKRCGMRSVVLTAKHHDGFCLWNTATTPYNSYSATPAHRDLVAELAQACREENLGFGLYFSLIDWHYPYAMPFSSHNADPITPLHHDYNMAQVRELLGNYGPVQELWFDMGSLTPRQSSELYALVHSLQPHCMVSGRLGNDYADFCVMADNQLPDYPMLLPWQTAASVFKETWGYRSWQERGNKEDKIREKASELVRVVAGGGKYLLNIGPTGSGAVVPFEQEVLEGIGAFVNGVQEAVYGTHPAPWTAHGDVPSATVNAAGDRLYLFLPTTPNAGGELQQLSARIPALQGRARKATLQGGAKGGVSLDRQADGSYRVAVSTRSDAPFVVLAVGFAPGGIRLKEEPVREPLLCAGNAEGLFAQSAVDYYTSFKSILGYRWTLPRIPSGTAALYFTEQENGKEIVTEWGGKTRTLTLIPEQEEQIRVDTTAVQWVDMAQYKGRGGLFGTMLTAQEIRQRGTAEAVDRSLHGAGNIVYRDYRLNASASLLYPVRIRYAQGVLVYLDGRYLAGHIAPLPQDGALHEMLLLLPLTDGAHHLTVKCRHSSARGAVLELTPQAEYTRYRMSLPLEGARGTLAVRKPIAPPAAAPAGLYNLQIRLP